jgi:hypothetical protein
MRQWMMAVGFLLAAPAYAAAAPIVLTFEGVGDLANIQNFYNGGTDSQGHSGPNVGVSFVTGALGLIDQDAGGSGNIAREPSGQTILFFLDTASAIMTVPAGFDTGFSFFFSANPQVGNGTVTVYDGINGTGNVLATSVLNASLTPQSGCGGGDPNGTYSCWAPVGVAFSGIARSIAFGGAANFIVFDDVTFGSVTPGGGGTGGGGGTVPEPASMMLFGLATLGAATRRRRAARN